MKSDPKAPKHLSIEAKKWWNEIGREYVIRDEGGLLLLQTALEAFDRMREAQRVLSAEGPFVKDKFDQPKAHPALDSEHRSRAHMLLALKQLNLDITSEQAGAVNPFGGSVKLAKR